jgi:uncharacterized protein YbaR (Trm112 family)
MKKLFRFLFFGVVIGAVVYFVKQQMAQGEDGSASGVVPSQPIKPLEERPLGGSISPELLKILVCPEDKGPLELIDGGKYLLNPRNGYRYPIRDGIPVMLIDEGKKNQDASLVRGNGATKKEVEAAG